MMQSLILTIWYVQKTSKMPQKWEASLKSAFQKTNTTFKYYIKLTLPSKLIVRWLYASIQIVSQI